MNLYTSRQFEISGRNVIRALILNYLLHIAKLSQRNGKNFHEGKYWASLSYSKIEDRLKLGSTRKVRYHLTKLVADGILQKCPNSALKNHVNIFTFSDELYIELVGAVTKNGTSATKNVMLCDESVMPETKSVTPCAENVIDMTKTAGGGDENGTIVDEIKYKKEYPKELYERVEEKGGEKATQAHANPYSEKIEEEAPLLSISHFIKNNKTEPQVDPQDVLDIYNRAVDEKGGLIRADDLTPERIEQIAETSKTRLKTIQDWETYIYSLFRSKFLKGHNKRKWRACFGWAIQIENVVKVFEGKFFEGVGSFKSSIDKHEQEFIDRVATPSQKQFIEEVMRQINS